GLRGAQRRVVGRHLVTVGDDALHQAVEAGRPADHPIAGPVSAVPAGDHLTGDFVDREAVLLGATATMVAGEEAADAAEGGHVAAADTRGQKLKQHLAVGQAVRRLLGDRDPLELVGRDEPVAPHLTPPPEACSSPTESWTAGAPPTRR